MDADAYVQNLAHVAALTTLLGSKTAESLTYGSRGAAGLPWAAMSSFGSLHVIRACAAGCLPAWLRETFSLNSTICQAVLGRSLPADDRSMLKAASDDCRGISARYVSDAIANPPTFLQS